MTRRSHEEIVAWLVRAGARRDVAVQYADLFCAYREATDSIRSNGVIVLHPRTGVPLANPYLQIRSEIGAGLARLRLVAGAAELWADDAIEAGPAVVVPAPAAGE